MVKWLMRRGISAFERQWTYDASYVREIIEASPHAAWMFSRAAAIGLERAAFLLHDVFDYSFTQVADTLGRTEAACRQLASRARTRVRDARPAGAIPTRPGSRSVDAKHAEPVSAFITASRSGDVATLTRLLTSDARVVSDGGGKVAAALNVIEGAERVAAFLGCPQGVDRRVDGSLRHEATAYLG